MRGIKHVLTERFYAWEDAVKLAESDPEIDLSGKGRAFTPKEFLEEEAADAKVVDYLVEEEVAEVKAEEKAVVPPPETNVQGEAARL